MTTRNSLSVFQRTGPVLRAAVLAVAVAMLPAGWAHAAGNSIQAINYSTLPGGKMVVKIDLKDDLTAAPAGFTVNNPPRIALDFANTANGLNKSTVNVDEGVLRSVNVVQAGGRTRLVMNLNRSVNYDTRIENGDLLVTLQGAETAASSNVTTQFAPNQATAQPHRIRDVDFRRGKNNEGRVLVGLSDATTGIDIRVQGKSIVVDFLNTALPKNLERRLDVLDFGTPIQIVDTFTVGNNTRMIIEPKGLWEHSAYQADREFILEVKPVVEDPTRIAQGSKPKFTGDKLSLNFQNVDVRSVLQVIADFTGLNIITSDSVSGNLTLRLKDVPWDQALDIILQSKGLAMRKSGTVVWIAPSDELATREKLELEAKQQIAELEPVQTETFQLRYHKADAFKKILTDDKQKILSKRGSAVIDERTNTLFIQDTPSKLEEVRRLIAQIDVPVKQVLIESRIVEANDGFSKNLGARLGLFDQQTRPGTANSSGYRANVSGGKAESPAFQTGQIDPDEKIDWKDSLGVNLAAGAIRGFNPGALALSIFRANSARFLNLEISALQADGKGKVISSPRVVTADQTEAVIEQGTEIPFQQATSSGATSITFKKAVLSLKVKPQITPDDNIIMDLRVNRDSPDYPNTTVAGPPINTKQISTQVLVENGGTVVIGGIYTQDQTDTVTKVPVLGDVPVVGVLFRNRATRDDRSELLIFVTPKILKEGLTMR